MFEFDKAVLSNTGKYKPFDHGEYLKTLSIQFKKGACFALSTLFLSRFDKSQNTDQDTGQLKFTDAADNEKVRALVSQLQANENARKKLSTECSQEIFGYVKVIESHQEQLKGVLETKRLKEVALHLKEDESGSVSQEDLKHHLELFKELDKLFDELKKEADDAHAKCLEVNDYFEKNLKFGKKFLEGLGLFGLKKGALTVDDVKFSSSDPIQNTLCQNDGRYLISLPGHSVAAIISPAKWKFFDPNFGQGVFDNANKFKAFLRTYLDDGYIKKVYKLDTGKVTLFATAI
jgi:hypothetical protein